MKVILFLALVTFALGFDVKHLAGPAETFPYHDMADPKDTVTEEESFTQYIWFQQADQNGVIYSTVFPVEGTDFAFTYASPSEKDVELQLVDPNGKVVDLKPIAQKSFWPLGDSVQFPMTVYVINDGIEGLYKLNILQGGLTDNDVQQLGQSINPNAIVILRNNDNVIMRTHLTTYLLRVGEPIGLVSTVIDKNIGLTPSDITVTLAEMEVITPDGQDIDIPMTDNAAFLSDPQPGVYAAQMTAKKAGQYTVHAKLQGHFQDATLDKEIVFERTTQHVIHVSSATLEIAGTAKLAKLDSTRVNLNIDLTNIETQQPNLRGYAQVWGIDAATGKEAPACWVGGIVNIENSQVSLQLDTKWLQRAGVKGPLTLKNTYLSDLSTSFPVAAFDGPINVQDSDIPLVITPQMRDMEITKEMLYGVNPLPPKNETKAAASPYSLILLPGYCSATNPFYPHSTDDFTGGLYFNQQLNAGNDEFTKRVLTFLAPYDLESYSIIGHSQGGMVALHMYNYYWSSLDLATGGRLIQSVGTPWEGCTGAGSGADFIKLFGYGCGANSDLTRDGAVNWLKGIKQDSMKQVYYYTTTYEQGNLFGDYCNLAVNMILEWPNDGTTEIVYAKLLFGTYVSNTQKYCHTTDMAYPAQYDNHTKNKEMNSMAGR